MNTFYIQIGKFYFSSASVFCIILCWTYKMDTTNELWLKRSECWFKSHLLLEGKGSDLKRLRTVKPARTAVGPLTELPPAAERIVWWLYQCWHFWKLSPALHSNASESCLTGFINNQPSTLGMTSSVFLWLNCEQKWAICQSHCQLSCFFSATVAPS